MTVVYLASPIDLHNNRIEVANLRNEWIRNLHEMGFAAVYTPDQAWEVGPEVEPSESLQRVNLAALQACDALVAILPQGVPSLGVPLEIHMATSLGKPTLIVGGSQSSWTLAWFARGGSMFYADQPGLVAFARAVAESLPPTKEEAEWDQRTQDWVARNERRKEMKR